MNEIVDLHCHTSASGGAIGFPTEVPKFFKERGYKAFAITEHDSIDSLEPAQRVAEEIGIECISGVEATIAVDDPQLPNGPTHILVFAYERTPAFEELFQRTTRRSAERMRAALENLRKAGVVAISEQELIDGIAEVFGEEDIWKKPYHCVGPVGDLLVKRGLVGPEDNSNNAARALLAEYADKDLPQPYPTLDEALPIFRQAGAVLCLAHPGNRTLTHLEVDMRKRLEYWMEHYVDGIEVYTVKHQASFSADLQELVDAWGRPFSGGSDTHCYNPSVPYSQAPYDCVESIKAWKSKLCVSS